MKIKRKRFTVEGSGAFPFDMLRYDACWPESEARDSYQLQLSFQTDATEYLKRRRVTLLSDDRNAPTEGRWKSFNWRVVESGFAILALVVTLSASSSADAHGGKSRACHRHDVSTVHCH